MRESNSQQWFWRPLLYHLTNPLFFWNKLIVTHDPLYFNIYLIFLDLYSPVSPETMHPKKDAFISAYFSFRTSFIFSFAASTVSWYGVNVQILPFPQWFIVSPSLPSTFCSIISKLGSSIPALIRFLIIL